MVVAEVAEVEESHVIGIKEKPGFTHHRVSGPKRVVICENAPDRAELFRRRLMDPNMHRGIGEVTVQTVPVHDGARMPDSYDVLIATGGPMSADESARRAYPYLQYAFDLLREIIRAKNGPRVLGVCLGKQLLTWAGGGRVVPGPWARGWHAVTFLEGNPWGLEGRYPLMEFHENHVVELPEGALKLASSVASRYEAFSMDNHRIIGTCFHPEYTPGESLGLLEDDARANGAVMPYDWHKSPDEQASRHASNALFRWLVS